ncbi:general transcription factor IIH subunit 4-like [Amblyraja radiata]|uniref:general transcription factor IIH subunit 4-like n=1 Tax=Amblyraja radiata TaxID=386614 RepID=UPI0014028E0F|nr:general transcription factor IIH subunit 4-like [Amblyraja radiata]
MLEAGIDVGAAAVTETQSDMTRETNRLCPWSDTTTYRSRPVLQGPGSCAVRVEVSVVSPLTQVCVCFPQTPVLPPTITDQVRLWELERDRLQFTEGVLYNQFLSQVDFELLRDYARDLGVLVWENPPKRLMVVTPTGHPDVKRFWKRQKHN